MVSPKAVCWMCVTVIRSGSPCLSPPRIEGFSRLLSMIHVGTGLAAIGQSDWIPFLLEQQVQLVGGIERTGSVPFDVKMSAMFCFLGPRWPLSDTQPTENNSAAPVSKEW